MLNLRLFFAGAAILGSLLSLSAKPADPRPRHFLQPNGDTITVLLRGDERHHFYLSEDYHPLVLSNDAFMYAKIAADGDVVPSDILAHNPRRRSAAELSFLQQHDSQAILDALQRNAQKSPRMNSPQRANAADDTAERGLQIISTKTFPKTGEPNVLVVLVEYQDVKFNLEDPYDYFYNMNNEPGFSQYGGTGSVKDFFRENSMEQFLPHFDVYGPVTLPNNMKYYGENDAKGNDKRPHMMAVHACELLDEEVDFSQYDNDGDGFIDNIYLYYAGDGEASYGESNTVWPHAWEISSATNKIYEFDGVRLESYGCSNEWEKDVPCGIATFVHEFSHVLGLPDLYATTYSGAFTPGEWSVLDYGSYNNDCHTPPNYSAFERYSLGWLKPTEIRGSGEIKIENITNNEAYIINTDRSNEYYILENRQQEGWDEFLPGHGMLLWHIDFNQNVWDQNIVNNSNTHQYADLIEADGKKNSSTRDGDSFPGTQNVTTINYDTNPALKPWSGKSLGISLDNIIEENGTISLCVISRPTDDTTVRDNAPAAVDDLTVIFDGIGHVGTISFTMPSLTYAGEALTDPVGYAILRDNQLLKMVETSAPALTIEYEDEVPMTGIYKYSIYAFNDCGDGPTTKCELWVGPDTPAAPGNVSVSYSDGTFTVAWDAVERGVHGGALYSDATYKVTMYCDGTVAGSYDAEAGVTSIEIAELEPQDLTIYSFGVQALTVDDKSAETKSANFPLGAVATPYEQHFDELSAMDAFVIVDGNDDGYIWKYANGKVNITSNPDMGHDDWLITPQIDLKAGCEYQLIVTARKLSDQSTEAIEVAYGRYPTVDAMTEIIIEPTELTETDEDYKAIVRTDEGGRCNIGIHAISDAAQAGIAVSAITVREDATTRIESVAAGRNVLIHAHAGEVAVTGAEGAVSIYTADGKLVYQAEKERHHVRLLPGIYIVEADGVKRKVIL